MNAFVSLLPEIDNLTKTESGAVSVPLASGLPLLFVIGAPRSGTTWLAKMFDSHPDVLYRNEPDTVLHEPRLPLLCPPEDIARHRALTADYLTRLIALRSLKSAGSLPVFRKRDQSKLAHRLRTGLIYALHAAATARHWLPEDAVERVPIPDPGHAAPLVVIKSVNARGRARLFAAAAPGSRIVFILRHPCAQVSSVLRGVRSGEFAPPDRHEILGTALAARHGLTKARFDALTPAEQFAWHWAILNQMALDDLADLGPERVRLVHYRDVVAAPLPAMNALFAFAGLPPDRQAEAFLERSTSYSGRDGYYTVMKGNAEAEVDRWRTELAAEDQRRILAIAEQFAVGRAFIPVPAAAPMA